MELGETPAEAARRECWEETGLRATVHGEVTRYANADTNGRDLTCRTITYRVHLIADEGEVQLSVEEHDDFRWLKPSDALDLPLVWHVARTLGHARRW